MNVYNSSNTIVTIAGAIVLTEGKADGDWVTIDPTQDAYTITEGADGQPVVSKTNGRGYTVTVQLLETSPHNAELATLHALSLNVSPQVVPFALAKSDGPTLAFGTCIITREPTLTGSKEVPTKTWTLFLDGTVFQG